MALTCPGMSDGSLKCLIFLWSLHSPILFTDCFTFAPISADAHTSSSFSLLDDVPASTLTEKTEPSEGSFHRLAPPSAYLPCICCHILSLLFVTKHEISMLYPKPFPLLLGTGAHLPLILKDITLVIPPSVFCITSFPLSTR